MVCPSTVAPDCRARLGSASTTLITDADPHFRYRSTTFHWPSHSEQSHHHWNNLIAQGIRISLCGDNGSPPIVEERLRSTGVLEQWLQSCGVQGVIRCTKPCTTAPTNASTRCRRPAKVSSSPSARSDGIVDGSMFAQRVLVSVKMTRHLE